MNEAGLAVAERLSEQTILRFERGDWESVADQFDEVERHRTHIKGDLVVVRLDSRFAAVEEPLPNERVVRCLPNMDEVRRFVTDRLETYERMWDGCGCRIDYYS
jgi:hypothetical protein